jgi:hypothetical protein
MANIIKVKFQADGARAMKTAIDSLAVAQERLNKGNKRAEALQKKLNRELDKYNRNAIFATRNTRLTGGAFATMRSQLLLASFAFTLVNSSILRLGRSYGEQEQAEKRLEHVIGKSSASLKAHASALQEVTRFGDEETLGAMTLVGAYTTNEQAIASLTEAAQDLATVKNMDLKTATDMLAKSVFSSTNSMQRYGIQIDGTAGSTDRLNSALKAISTQMGGASEEDAKTFLGALDQMGNAVGDVGEDLGRALAPAIVSVAKAVKSFAESLDADQVEKFLSILAGGGIVYLSYAAATRIATTATMLFTKATKKNIAILAAMLIVGKVIDQMDLFASSTDDLDDEIKKLNEDLKNGINIAKDDFEAKKQAMEMAHKENQANLLNTAAIEKLTEARENGIHADLASIDARVELAAVQQEIENLNQLDEARLLTSNELKEKELNLLKLTTKERNLQAKAVMNEAKAREQAGNKTIEVLGKVNEAFNTNAKSMRDIQFALAMIDAFKTFTATKNLLSAGGVPPVISGILATAEFAATAAMANKIRTEQFEQGGLVGGRRHSQGGTIIEAERGEFVMSRDAVESIGVDNLEAMNAGGGGASVVINNPIISSEFVESELPELISEAVRKGVDFGMS